MNFKQMILIDHLLNNTINGWNRPNSKLIFELDNKIFTGNFTPKNNNGEPVSYYFHEYLGGFDTKVIFNSDSSQQLRTLLFKHVFGKSADNTGNAFEHYITNLKHLVLNDVIDVISKVDTKDYFPDNLKVPEILYGLENVVTGQKFDYYIATNKTFKPVSYIDLSAETVE